MGGSWKNILGVLTFSFISVL